MDLKNYNLIKTTQICKNFSDNYGFALQESRVVLRRVCLYSVCVYVVCGCVGIRFPLRFPDCKASSCAEGFLGWSEKYIMWPRTKNTKSRKWSQPWLGEVAGRRECTGTDIFRSSSVCFTFSINFGRTNLMYTTELPTWTCSPVCQRFATLNFMFPLQQLGLRVVEKSVGAGVRDKNENLIQEMPRDRMERGRVKIACSAVRFLGTWPANLSRDLRRNVCGGWSVWQRRQILLQWKSDACRIYPQQPCQQLNPDMGQNKTMLPATNLRQANRFSLWFRLVSLGFASCYLMTFDLVWPGSTWFYPFPCWTLNLVKRHIAVQTN